MSDADRLRRSDRCRYADLWRTLMIQGIHALIDATESKPHRFPPTLLYNEGWMLRLVLDWFKTHEAQGHPCRSR